jgi:hypothetical protein
MITRGASPGILPEQTVQGELFYCLVHHPHQVIGGDHLFVTALYQRYLIHHIRLEDWQASFLFVHAPIESRLLYFVKGLPYFLDSPWKALPF